MAVFLSKSVEYKIYLEESETLLTGNRIKRKLRKVEFKGGRFETKDEALIVELREVEGFGKDFHEIKGQDLDTVKAVQAVLAGQSASEVSNTPKKKWGHL